MSDLQSLLKKSMGGSVAYGLEGVTVGGCASMALDDFAQIVAHKMHGGLVPGIKPAGQKRVKEEKQGPKGPRPTKGVIPPHLAAKLKPLAQCETKYRYKKDGTPVEMKPTCYEQPSALKKSSKVNKWLTSIGYVTPYIDGFSRQKVRGHMVKAILQVANSTKSDDLWEAYHMIVHDNPALASMD